MLVWLQHEKNCFAAYLPCMEGKAMKKTSQLSQAAGLEARGVHPVSYPTGNTGVGRMVGGMEGENYVW